MNTPKLYRIEKPQGETYSLEGFGVYAYDEYPRHSVLAGQVRRQFVGRFDSLIEAVHACPVVPDIDRDL